MLYNQKNVMYARNLRKEMTPWERKLWYCFLNRYDVRFQRQKPIGQYIADFYCSKAKLVIELDGGGHYEEKAEERDSQRTRYMEQMGIFVIRFCNTDIDRNFESVCMVIDREVKNRMNR